MTHELDMYSLRVGPINLVYGSLVWEYTAVVSNPGTLCTVYCASLLSVCAGKKSCFCNRKGSRCMHGKLMFPEIKTMNSICTLLLSSMKSYSNSSVLFLFYAYECIKIVTLFVVQKTSRREFENILVYIQQCL